MPSLRLPIAVLGFAVAALCVPPRGLPAQDVVIGEFLAVNDGSTLDEDGDASDWIELHAPGPVAVPLAGWSLTDDPLELQKWPLPDVVLEAGGFLVVFASGKNRTDPAGELHAGFKLAGEGEFLAVVRPDGTVEHAYDPAFPRQVEGISYGLGGGGATLVEPGAPADWWVPDSGAVDASWTDAGFTPGAAWSTGPTGLGYHAGGDAGFAPPLSYWSFDGHTADLVGPNDGNFVGGIPDYVSGFDGLPDSALAFDGASQYVEISQISGLPLYDNPAFSIAMWVKGGPQGDNRVWSEGSTASDSPLFNIGTDNGGSTDQVDLFVRTAGGTEINHLHSDGGAFDGTWHHIAWVDVNGDAVLYIDGELDPQDFSYSRPPLDLDVTSIGAVLRASGCCFFDGQIDEVAVWDVALTPAEVDALAAGGSPGEGSSYGAFIETDVESEMKGLGTSAYVRIPFEVEDPDDLVSLSLALRYDDGFVAYINGVEVARANAPAVPAWNSVATAEHTGDDGIQLESFNVSAALAELVPGTNLLAIHGLNRAADDESFLVQAYLSASSSPTGLERYFSTPTPGGPNTGGSVDFVADTKFSIDRGFYDAPFEVEITTDTVGAEIRYTVDGTAPTAAHGEIYTGPLLIDTTTTLRAAAFKSGFEPTNVDTHTYIFLEDVLRQPDNPPGYPSTWAGNPADYGMDPEITTDTGSPTFDPTVAEALLAIPTMSIVMDPDDWMGSSRGIYQHPLNRGSAWERAASIEFILPEGMAAPDPSGEGFQFNCGVRMQGGSSARGYEGKHSYRLTFKDEYGPTKLRYKLFPDSPMERFNTLTLRCCSTDSWHFKDGGARYRRWDSQYIRDVWMRDTQLAMSQPSSHGTYVHLYVNGLYWGLYNPTERPDDSFFFEYDRLGTDPQSADETDWDVMKDFNELFRGNRTAWDQLMNACSNGLSSQAAYERVQGNNPDGTPNLSYPVMLDVENLIDYMILHLYACSEDWPHHNWYGGRSRSDLSRGWRFFVWDQEIVMDFQFRNRIGVNNTNSPAYVYAACRQNEEFRLHFADRVQRHLFQGGPLSNEGAQQIWLRRADEIDHAIVGESARWGDFRMDVPDPSNSPAELYTREDHWLPEKQKVLDEYIPESHRLAMERFRSANLYPDVEPPQFSQHGGLISRGFELALAAPSGTIYYTLDGTDPRLVGGAVSPTAIQAGVGASEVLLAADVPARWLVPDDDSLGLDWTATEFDDGGWTPGTSALGYETSSGYEDHFSTDTETAMYDENGSVYLRVKFDVEDPSEFAFLRLRMKYDDGFVAFLNGVQVASANAPADVAWDSLADGSHADGLAVEFSEFEMTGGAEALRAGENVLAIHGLNASQTSSDFLIVPEVRGGSVAEGGGIAIDRTSLVKSRTQQGGEWSALQEAVFILDEPSPLRITEIHYHPMYGGPDDPYDADDYEFIELQNISDDLVALVGVQIAGGIQFDFGRDDLYLIEPGEAVVIVKDIDAFEFRYDTAGMLIAGEYTGRLANGGDEIVLLDARGEAILDFSYDDVWYPVTDGGGSSLEIVDAQGAPANWHLPGSWQPSAVDGGTPGTNPLGPPPTGGWQAIGDANQDASVDISDAVVMLRLLFGGGQQLSPPCGGEIDQGGSLVVLDFNSDSGVNLSDPIALLNYLFAGGAPSPLGEGCVRVEGCVDVCAAGGP